MLNYIWLGLILAAVLIGAATGRMEQVTNGALDSARMAVMNIALPLAGLLAMWLGIMRLAEKSGIIYIIASGIRPVMKRLFPDVPAQHPAMGAMIMNISANMLGLGNAATPFGIKAMKYLDTLSPRPGVATNAMCTFLAINTSSVQLVSLTAVGVFVAAGAAMPTAFIPTALLATICSTTVGLIAVKTLEKLPIYRMPEMTQEEVEAAHRAREKEAEAEPAPEMTRPQRLAAWKKGIIVAFFALFALVFAAAVYPPMNTWTGPLEETIPALAPDPASETATVQEATVPATPRDWLTRVMQVIAILAIPFIVAFFPLYASLQGVKIYEEFVEGAKEGFQIAVRIMPYLVAILVAIGMFRAAEGIALVGFLLGDILEFLRFPVDLLPIALLRPLSGSGTLGLLSELVATHGPDSFIARAAGTMAGSTETTFYVLAVYFGAVGIRRTRHAVPAGLIADLAGIIAAVTIATIVFGPAS